MTKENIKEILDVSKPLAEKNIVLASDYIEVLQGIYRDSYFTLRDIFYLSHHEYTGRSISALSRKIIENAVTVEYIAKDKEKLSKKFKNHVWKQYNDIVEHQKKHYDNLPSIEKLIGVKTTEVKEKYSRLNRKTKERTSWAGISIEDMAKELKDDEVDDAYLDRIKMLYAYGCWQVHVNPFNILTMVDEQKYQAIDYFNREFGYIICSFFLRISTHYLNEIPKNEKNKAVIEVEVRLSDIFNLLFKKDVKG